MARRCLGIRRKTVHQVVLCSVDGHDLVALERSVRTEKVLRVLFEAAAPTFLELARELAGTVTPLHEDGEGDAWTELPRVLDQIGKASSAILDMIEIAVVEKRGRRSAVGKQRQRRARMPLAQDSGDFPQKVWQVRPTKIGTASIAWISAAGI